MNIWSLYKSINIIN